MTQVGKISIRKLVLECDGKRAPVFLNNPTFYLNTGNDTVVKRINNEFKTECIVRLACYTSNLKLFHKIKANMEAGKIKKSKYQLLNFINDSEIKAFEPNVTILNFLLEYCRKYNAYDVLEECLNELGALLLKEIPNFKVSTDVKVIMNTTNSRIRFRWVNNMDIDLVKR